MFERLLKFFITNSRMNYTLFFLVFAVGIYSYIKMPKEIFPAFDLDMITIKGSYTGASIDVLDKMAVVEIENNTKNIDGVKETSTIILPGRFTIILELKEGEDKYEILDTVKDAITLIKENLPDDMNEPVSKVVKTGRPLLSVSILSDTLELDKLKEEGKDLKDRLSAVKNVSSVTFYGDSQKYLNIKINEKKIEALGLSPKDINLAISNISYIFPLGKLEESKKEHFFISMENSKQNKQDLENTLIKVANKRFYLKDIATIEKKYKDSSTLALLDSKSSLTLAVNQNEDGNAVEIAKDIQDLITKENLKNNNYILKLHHDNSKKIKDRLNIVISNIIFGVILLTILLIFLVNTRMALIIALGIPTSFVIAAIYFYLFGYTINMLSLVGVLIALGIVVDDAIVVGENIQQYIEKGFAPEESAVMGAKEMAKPVFIASITTVFSFIPALLISGTMGEFVKLIPIAVSALVIASLIESFIFLPIHGAHILSSKSKTMSWDRANRIYSVIIHKLMTYKKTFLFTFIILVPIFTFLGIKSSKFQMFPRFDSSTIYVTLKAPNNTKLEETYEILKEVEADLMSKKEEFYIKTISSVVGYRKTKASTTENYPYVGYLTIEFETIKAQNIVDKYITPNLSLYYDDTERRIREDKSKKIGKKLRKFLKEKRYKERYNLSDIGVPEKKVGPVKTDIKLALSANSDEKTIEAIDKIKTALLKINGVNSVFNNLSFGIDEIKIKINNYGESLGLSQRQVGVAISDLFLNKKKAISFDDKDMLDISIESFNKDKIETLKNYNFPLPDGSFVSLEDVTELRIVKTFELVTKEDGEKEFFVYANVDPKIITSGEVLELIEPTLDEVRAMGVKIAFKGEKKKNKELKNDMIVATSLAMVLIMLAMLYLFNSFRESFMLMSVIPFSILGVIIGHKIMGLNFSMISLIGALGLAGVVINDGIIMIDKLKKATNMDEIFEFSASRLRPIVLTTLTTLIGLSTLIFFPTGQAVIFQPLAVALGFGLAWGTILNLLYLPTIYTVFRR